VTAEIWVLLGLFIALIASFMFAIWVSRYAKGPDEYDRMVEEGERPGACPGKLEPESPKEFRTKWGIGEK
jgi:hypothetical protein